MRLLRGFVVLISVLLCALSQAQTVRQVNLQTNHIVYDPGSGLIYASIPSTGGARGNTITTINPTTGVVASQGFIGSEPNALALSDNGQYLYIGIDGAHAVRRYNLAAKSREIQFSLGSDPSLGFYKAGSIAVLPGQPKVVAVTRNFTGVSPANNGVAIYDDGVLRSNVLLRGTNLYDSLAVSDSQTKLYAVDGSTSEFLQLKVDAQGVTRDGVIGNLRFRTVFDKSDRRFYASSGFVADLDKKSLAGRLLPGDQTGVDQIFGTAPDAANHRVFLLSGITTFVNNSPGYVVSVYDSNTFLPGGSAVIANIPSSSYFNASDFTVCGSDAVAFRTDSTVYIVTGLNLPGLASLTFSSSSAAGGSAFSGTVTLTRPAPANGLNVFLNTNSGLSGVSVPAKVFIPEGSTSGTFTVTTTAVPKSFDTIITATYGVQQLKQSVTILDSASTPSYPANIRVLNLRANDLQYDNVGKRLWASIPSSAGSLGNGLTSIDPVTGAIDRSLFLGSEPGTLAISDNGQYLYSSLDGALSISRFNLSSFTPDKQIAIGGDKFGQAQATNLVVEPGSPETLAVRRKGIGYALNQDGVVVFQNGVELSGRYDGPYVANSLAFGAASGRLYGYNNLTTGFELARLSVGDQGITLQDTTSNLISGFNVKIAYDAGRLYASSGQVVDPEALQPIGVFSSVGGNAVVVPDTANKRIYFVSQDLSGTQTTLRVYDPNTFLLKETYNLPGIYGSLGRLVACGPDLLAFNTRGGQIVLLNAREPRPGSLRVSPSPIAGLKTGKGTLILTNVAPVGGLTVTLSSSNPAAASVPATLTFAEGIGTVSFPITTSAVTAPTNVTITATYGKNIRTTVLTVNVPDGIITVPNVSSFMGRTVNLRALLRRLPDGTRQGGKTIAFSVDGVSAGSAVTDATGLATLSYTLTTALGIGPKTITATFAGDGSVSATIGTGTLTFQYTSLLSVSNLKSRPEQTVTLRSLLRRRPDGAAVVGKTVTFSLEGAVVGTGVTGSDGIATLDYALPASLGTGTKTISVAFAGDSDFLPITSTGSLAIGEPSVASIRNVSGKAGQTVSLRGLLRRRSDGSGLSGKTLTFRVNGAVVGTLTTGTDGVATLSYVIPAGTATGVLPTAVEFAGDTDNFASTGAGTLTILP